MRVTPPLRRSVLMALLIFKIRGAISIRNVSVDDTHSIINYVGDWSQAPGGTSGHHHISRSPSIVEAANFRFRGGSVIYFVAPLFAFPLVVEFKLDFASDNPIRTTVDLQDYQYDGPETTAPVSSSTIWLTIPLSPDEHLVEIAADRTSERAIVDQFIITMEDDEEFPGLSGNGPSPRPSAATSRGSSSTRPGSSSSSSSSTPSSSTSTSESSASSRSSSDSSTKSNSSPVPTESSPRTLILGRPSTESLSIPSTISEPSSGQPALPTAAKAAIGVISGVAALVFVIVFVWLCRRRRRALVNPSTPVDEMSSPPTDHSSPVSYLPTPFSLFRNSGSGIPFFSKSPSRTVAPRAPSYPPRSPTAPPTDAPPPDYELVAGDNNVASPSTAIRKERYLTSPIVARHQAHS